MGIALGLAAAMSWGFSDFCATHASRRIGPFQVVLGFHALSILALGIAVAATGGLEGLQSGQALVLLGLGALGWVSYLAFYRALAIGPISIVSPVVSGYAAIAVVLAVILLGETLGGGELAAVIVAFSGVVLASVDLDHGAGARRAGLTGILLALVAMVAIGGFVFGVSYYSPELGWLGPIFLARVGTGLFVALTAIRGGQWRFPERSRTVLGLVGAVAALDTAGYVAFNIGVREAETSLVATAAAPYAVVPIALGVLTMHERPKPLHWLGIALVISGLVLLGLFS